MEAESLFDNCLYIAVRRRVHGAVPWRALQPDRARIEGAGSIFTGVFDG